MWPEFLTVALAHFLAVASPGPDLAFILKQALTQGRSHALLAAAGISLGVSLHIALAATGMATLIQLFPGFLLVLQLAGGSYLFWLGYTAREPSAAVDPAHASGQDAAHPFRQGLLVNLLNPKVSLFFISLFSVLGSWNISVFWLLLFSAWMVLANFLWFAGVSWLVGGPGTRSCLACFAPWISRASAFLFMGLGVWLWTDALLQALN